MDKVAMGHASRGVQQADGLPGITIGKLMLNKYKLNIILNRKLTNVQM